jgi:hypothetical protein
MVALILGGSARAVPSRLWTPLFEMRPPEDECQAEIRAWYTRYRQGSLQVFLRLSMTMEHF